MGKFLVIIAASIFLVSCEKTPLEKCYARVQDMKNDCVASGRDSFGAGVGGRCSAPALRGTFQCSENYGALLLVLSRYKEIV